MTRKLILAVAVASTNNRGVTIQHSLDFRMPHHFPIVSCNSQKYETFRRGGRDRGAYATS
jgi:hypothetical protein